MGGWAQQLLDWRWVGLELHAEISAARYFVRGAGREVLAHAELRDPSGRYRIEIGSFSSVSEARAACEQDAAGLCRREREERPAVDVRIAQRRRRAAKADKGRQRPGRIILLWVGPPPSGYPLAIKPTSCYEWVLPTHNSGYMGEYGLCNPPIGETAMSDGDRLERIGKAMMAAWSRVKKSQARMWGDWMTVGEGLLEGRRWAMQRAGTNTPEGKGYVMAYGEWLKRFKVDDMDKSDRAKLLQLMEERPAVEEWRASLTDYDRRNLNNPTIAWRKWTAATRVKKPKPRTAGVSATEHGRAQGLIDQQQARIEELEEELASTEFKPTGTADDIAAQLIGMFGAKAKSIARAMLARLDGEESAEANAESAGGLVWTGDERKGFRAGGYTVEPCKMLGGAVQFEAHIPERHGFERRHLNPVPTAAEAKAQCEADYAQRQGGDK